VRLIHGDDLIRVGQPVRLAGVSKIAGLARVVDPDAELLARDDGGGRGDDQLVPVGPGGVDPDPVDPHQSHREQEVEVERLQVLGGTDREPGPAGEPPAEAVLVMDFVPQHVDAAVPVAGEVGVTDPG
jgi:hypothetical protein